MLEPTHALHPPILQFSVSVLQSKLVLEIPFPDEPDDVEYKVEFPMWSLDTFITEVEPPVDGNDQ